MKDASMNESSTKDVVPRKSGMSESAARFWLGIGIPVAALAAVFVPYLATRSALPDRLATHFDGSGAPDGSMTPGSFLVFTLVMVLSGVAAMVWLARSSKPLTASVAPVVVFLGGFFAALGSGLAMVTFISQRGLESWQDADDLVLLIVVPLVAAVIVGAGAARAAAALPVAAPAVAAESRPIMDLADGQHAVWATTVHSKWIARLAAVSMIVGVIAAIVTAWLVVLPSTIIGIIVLAISTLQVRADRTGLHVKYGLLPWPRTTVGVNEIESATVIDVRPMEWGGWGYRGSLKLMKQAAVVHRAGPGIRLDLHDGKVFVVTVDDPETPVALLNAEVARTTQPV